LPFGISMKLMAGSSSWATELAIQRFAAIHSFVRKINYMLFEPSSIYMLMANDRHNMTLINNRAIIAILVNFLLLVCFEQSETSIQEDSSIELCGYLILDLNSLLLLLILALSLL
jgi:hypothetical protein